MPTYQYACTECGHAFEQVQAFTDDALTECPQCHGRLRKKFNAVGVVFKGSGFYRNDSRSAGGDGGSSSEGGSDTKTESKSDAKSSSADSTSGAASDSKSGSKTTSDAKSSTSTDSSSSPAKSGSSTQAKAD